MDNGLPYRIRKIREDHNETMEEFGKKHFDPPASKGVVSNWENGYNKPNKKRLEKIAELGHVSVEYLLYGDKDVTTNMSLKEYLNYKLEEFIQEYFPQNLTIDKMLLKSSITSSEANYSKDNKKYADKINELGKKYIDNMYYSDITLETLRAVNSKLTVDNFIQYRENAWYEFKTFLDKEVIQLRFSTEKDIYYLINRLFINEFESKLINAISQFDTYEELNQFITSKIEPILSEAAEKINSAADDVIN